MTFRHAFAVIFIITFSWPAAVFAAPPAPALPDHGSILLRILGISLAVCVLAFLVIKHGLPKFQTHSGGRLKLIERLPIGPGQSVVLVEVDGASVALGVTSHAVSLLTASPQQNRLSFSSVLDDETMFHVKHSNEEEA